MKLLSLLVALVMLFFARIAWTQDVQSLGNHYLAKVVYLPATAFWTDTGIDLVADDTLEIQVRGIASGVLDLTQVTWWGPEGQAHGIATSEYPLPGKPVSSCIGRVGGSGELFYVGNIAVLRTNVSGRLYLGINDFIVGDNLGAFVAYIFTKEIVLSAPETQSTFPKSLRVDQNYPNPFNPSTQITFQVEKRQQVSFDIFNPSGQLVRTLAEGEFEVGTHSVSWDGRDNNGIKLASGAYFYQARTGNSSQTKKMLMLK